MVKYTVGLAGGLAAAGCPVALLTRDHDLEFGGEPGAMRKHVEHELGERVTHERLGGRLRDVGSWGEAARVRRRVGRFGADVVHLQDSVKNDPRLLAIATAWRSQPLALTVHDPETRPEEHVPRRETLAYRWLLRRAGLVFVHAEPLREQLIAAERPTAPIVVVPHGAASGPVTPLPETPMLLVFGRMSPYKGLDVLLDAMPAVWRSAPATRLTIAGGGPLPAHAVLSDERVAVRNEHVPEEEVPGLFAASTCVVLPYREASQSGVGSLAKQYGRAVVASAVGGLPELLSDGSGLLVAPESPPDLAAAVLTLVVDRDRAAAMGRSAAAAVADRFGWDRVASLTLDAYRRHLLTGRG